MIYSYKAYIVLFHSEKNTKTAFHLSMMRNAEKIAARRVKDAEQ